MLRSMPYMFLNVKKLTVALIVVFSSVPCWGAEFLVMAKRHWSYKDTMTIEEQTEYEKQYQIGDVVQVFPDGKLSDYATAGGKFYVIRIAGLDYELAKKYQEQWNENLDNSENALMVKRRIYRIRAADLPLAVRNKLKTDGVYNTTWAAVKSYIRNNQTGLDEQ